MERYYYRQVKGGVTIVDDVLTIDRPRLAGSLEVNDIYVVPPGEQWGTFAGMGFVKDEDVTPDRLICKGQTTPMSWRYEEDMNAAIAAFKNSGKWGLWSNDDEIEEEGQDV